MRIPLLATLLLVIPIQTFAQRTAAEAEVFLKNGPEAGQKLYDDSWAVLIGIDTYENWDDSRLSVPSVERMHQLLVEEQGFPESQVLTLTGNQASLQGIRDLLGGELPLTIGPEARLLIYWSGRTTTVELPGGGSISYLIPTDGANTARGYFSTCLSLRELRTLTDLLPAKHILFLVDAPLGGTELGDAPQSTLGSEGWVAHNAASRGRQILTSASPGESVTEAPEWEHSPLVAALAEGIGTGDADGNRDGVISSSELAAYASPRVFEKTAQGQTVRLRFLGEGQGELVLVAPKSEETAPPPPPPPAPVAMGHLQVNVSAPASRVYVAGVYRGEASPGTPLNLQNVGLGPVEVRVEAAGYEPVTQAVNLAPNQWSQTVVGQPIAGTTPASTSAGTSNQAPGAIRLTVPRILTEQAPASVSPPPASPEPPAALGPPRLSRRSGPPPEALIGGMSEVPAGEFWMGSEEGDRNERPAHTVRLDGFWIDRREVTVAEFTAYDSEYKPSRYSGCDTCPATDIAWEDAVSYCGSLGKRLPTEAEWEKACRGPDGLTYPWGEKEEAMAHFGDEWGAGAVSVGTFPPNDYGLYDMSGNAWEWVYDWYDEEYYSRSLEDNPVGTRGGRRRGMRGGSWYGSSTLRCWERNRMAPDKRSRNLGFRCVW